MNHLLRELAPVTEAGWEAIDAEASRALRNFLAARKLVDFSGPRGRQEAAITLGGTQALENDPHEGVAAAARLSQPLIELRAEFEVARGELDAIDRGSRSPDLDTVRVATRPIAEAEDGALVVSLRGGDFEIVCGRDLSIGYSGHTGDSVSLYVEETMTFRAHGPEAAVALVYGT